MQYRWMRALLVGLSILALVCVSVATTLGVRQISSVQERHSEHGLLNDKVKLARELVDGINAIGSAFSTVALPLDPDEREKIIESANTGFEAIQALVPKLISQNADVLKEDSLTRLKDALASIAHSWDEVRRSFGADMDPNEKAHHFVTLREDTAIVRDIVRNIEFVDRCRTRPVAFNSGHIGIDNKRPVVGDVVGCDAEISRPFLAPDISPESYVERMSRFTIATRRSLKRGDGSTSRSKT